MNQLEQSYESQIPPLTPRRFSRRNIEVSHTFPLVADMILKVFDAGVTKYMETGARMNIGEGFEKDRLKCLLA